MKQNISLIDEKKQSIVNDLCDMAQADPIIRKIIIFGSAARRECTEESDIDICYDINCSICDRRARELSVKTSGICGYYCDVVFYGIIGDDLRKEIDAVGITVYEADGQVNDGESL